MRAGWRSGGFTLVEVVIAVTLMSMIMLGLVAALRTFGNSGARLEEISLRSDNVRLIEKFLRETLTQSSPRLHVRSENLGAEPWFRGSAHELTWLGAVPARFGAGGLHHLRVATVDTGAAVRLVLQLVPFTGDHEPPDWSQAPTHTLLEGVTAFTIAYQRLSLDEWSDAWFDPGVLPGRVRVRVAAESGVWPELIFRVLAAEPGDLSQEGLARAGAGR